MKKKREAAPAADGAKPNRGSVTVASFTTTPTGKQRQQESAPHGSNGLKFESKLLALFLMRSRSLCWLQNLNLVYKENEDMGGKFDMESQTRTPAGKNTGGITAFRPNTQRDSKIIEKLQPMIYSTLILLVQEILSFVLIPR